MKERFFVSALAVAALAGNLNENKFIKMPCLSGIVNRKEDAARTLSIHYIFIISTAAAAIYKTP